MTPGRPSAPGRGTFKKRLPNAYSFLIRTRQAPVEGTPNTTSAGTIGRSEPSDPPVFPLPDAGGSVFGSVSRCVRQQERFGPSDSRKRPATRSERVLEQAVRLLDSLVGVLDLLVGLLDVVMGSLHQGL